MNRKIWAGLCFLVSGCADFGTLAPETNYTPLTPQGQLNACVLDEAKARVAEGTAFEDVSRTANQIANKCIRQLDMLDSGLYSQAVANAKSIINSFRTQ